MSGAGPSGAGLRPERTSARKLRSLAGCMTATAVVRGAADGAVELELASARPCRGCEGACLWRRLPASTLARLPADGAFAVGETVLVSLPDRDVLAGAVVLHGLPWAALLAGALAGFGASGSDFGSLLGAAAGLGAAFAAAPALRKPLERWLLGRLVIRRADA